MALKHFISLDDEVPGCPVMFGSALIEWWERGWPNETFDPDEAVERLAIAIREGDFEERD